MASRTTIPNVLDILTQLFAERMKLTVEQIQKDFDIQFTISPREGSVLSKVDAKLVRKAKLGSVGAHAPAS